MSLTCHEASLHVSQHECLRYVMTLRNGAKYNVTSYLSGSMSWLRDHYLNMNLWLSTENKDCETSMAYLFSAGAQPLFGSIVEGEQYHGGQISNDLI